MKRQLPRWYRDGGYIQPLGIALNIALVVLLLWLTGWGIYNYALGQARQNCHNFGARIDKTVTYDNLSWGDWDCFVQTENGWIPRMNLREVIDGE